MADISLIPKDYKEGPAPGATFSKVGLILLVLTALSLLIYGGLFFYCKSLDEQLNVLQNKAEEIDQQRDFEFEKKLISLEEALKNLKIILKNHLYWSNLFLSIENLTVPQVSFSDFSGTLEEDGSINLNLSGNTPGYTYLAKQMTSFAQDILTSTIEATKISIGTEEGIDFELTIKFVKDILLK